MIKKFPGLGTVRIKKKFLWKPKRIYEIMKWMETAYIKEMYVSTPFGYKWNSMEWSTKEKYQEYLEKLHRWD